MKRYLLTLAFAVFLLSSCVNSINDISPSSDSSKKSNKTYGTVEVTGRLTLNGALPAELITSLSALYSKSSARTAFPTVPAVDTLTYTLTAQNTAEGSTETYPVTLSADKSSYSVGIPVTDETRNFKITASISSSGVVILSGESEAFDISKTSPVGQKNILVAPLSSEDSKGLVSLRISVNSSIASQIGSMCVSYTENGTVKTQNFTKTGNNYDLSIGTISAGVITNGITSGAYPMTFEMYSGGITDGQCTGSRVYSFTETVNVFENMTTNTWVQNGEEPWFETTINAGLATTACKITSDLLAMWDTTDIYVSSESVQGTRTGSLAKPFSTLAAAAAVMNDSSKDYIIHVITNISDKSKLEDPIQANSITIRGENGYNTAGVPKTSLKAPDAGSGADNRPLHINTTVPVILQDIIISDGKTTKNGGGIYIEKNGAEVTLDYGAVVSKNTAKNPATDSDGRGGGIYVCEGATLNLKAGSCVGQKEASGQYTNPNEAVLGGGIFSNGTVNMYDGAVINGNIASRINSACSGGGVYLSSSNFNMYGGKVTNCYAYSPSNYTYDGGGFFIESNSTLDMRGGEISGCWAKSEGGAIYIFSQYCYMSGDAYIPSGAVKSAISGDSFQHGQGRNDISIQFSPITISGELTKHSLTDKAYITPRSYSSSVRLIVAKTGVTNYVYNRQKVKFGIKPQYSGETWGADPEGYLCKPIGSKPYPDAIGDIVFKDGSAEPYTVATLDDTTQKPYAIAVISYIQDLNPYRIVGIGLEEPASDLAWCSDTYGSYPFSISSFQYSSDGKTCSSKIEMVLGDNFNETNFPGFWWADHYSPSNAGTGLYSSGWYLPSRYELPVDNSFTKVKASFEKIGSTAISETWSPGRYRYMTAQEDATHETEYIYAYNYKDKRWDDSTPKTSTYNVRAVHEF